MSLGYRLEGPETAPVLVLSNSLGTTMALWDAQVPELVGNLRVLRYDHPGHGSSADVSAPASVEGLAQGLLELLDDAGLERVSFCGLSLGGMVGMALALDSPERIDGLVLGCTAAHLGPAEAWIARARLVRDQGTGAVSEAVLARWFTTDFVAAEPDTVERFRTMLEDTQPEGYAACCDAIATWDARRRVRAIEAPTLVIAGAEDPAIPPADAAVLAEAIADARLLVLPGAAHLANVQQPAAFARAVLEHLGARPTSQEAA